MVYAAEQAVQCGQSAQVGLVVADGAGVGSNRRDPSGPSDLHVPVLLVRSADGKEHIACMVICAMHPTVSHEDSRLVSADFPGMMRQFLQHDVLGPNCPVLYHCGAAGNQSPRHVTRANDFAEAERLGCLLGQSIRNALPPTDFHTHGRLERLTRLCDLPPKEFPPIEQAQQDLEHALARLDQLQSNHAPRQKIRTAEYDWFGAEETLTLARAAQNGRLEKMYPSCLPVEIQVLKVGPWAFVAWPGEIFVEYALAIKNQWDDTYMITLPTGSCRVILLPKRRRGKGAMKPPTRCSTLTAAGFWQMRRKICSNN